MNKARISTKKRKCKRTNKQKSQKLKNIMTETENTIQESITIDSVKHQKRSVNLKTGIAGTHPIGEAKRK